MWTSEDLEEAGVVQSFIGFLGRLLLCSIFILSSVHDFFNWAEVEQSVSKYISLWLQSYPNISWINNGFENLRDFSGVLLPAALLAKALGSILIIFGWGVRFGAVLLLLFLVPTTIIMHPFWLELSVDQPIQMIMFLKNTSMTGGVLILLAYGATCKKVGKTPAAAK